jgi:RHS repeat-associated protein
MLQQKDVLDFDDDTDVTEFTRHFYHRNALGSVMEITEMDEDVAVSYRYNPYGAVTITRNSQEQSSDPLGNPWVFTARFTDEETGLYHYRARAYSPVTGRFLQRDPLGYAGGSSLYIYVRQNPLNLVDPFGEKDRKPKDKKGKADKTSQRKGEGGPAASPYGGAEDDGADDGGSEDPAGMGTVAIPRGARSARASAVGVGAAARASVLTLILRWFLDCPGDSARPWKTCVCWVEFSVPGVGPDGEPVEKRETVHFVAPGKCFTNKHCTKLCEGLMVTIKTLVPAVADIIRIYGECG